MRRMAGKLVVVVLLTLCVCVYVLEMSGRWDRSIQDANDEAGFVAIVLCIGVALGAAGALITHMHAARTAERVMRAVSTVLRRCPDLRTVLPVDSNSPPVSLRI